MTSISRTLYPVSNSVSLIGRMQQQFDKLQVQLATGQRATNLAELGSSRYFDISVRARMGQIDGYSSSIDMVNVRLNAFNQAVTTMSSLQQQVRTAITPAAYGSNNVNFGTVPTLAKANIDQLVDILNTDVAGRYLFSGSKTDVAPVESSSTILDGAGGKAGFRQVAEERFTADSGGTGGHGRLTATVATDTVTLTEDNAPPFGFKLSTVTSSTATAGSLTITPPSGTPPQSLAVQFNALPTEGDTVTIGLTLPDGTSDTITMKAVSGTPGAPGEFQIGADADTTAGNFKTALEDALSSHVQTTLRAASNNQAANEYFNGQGTQVMRVDPGTPADLATATSLMAADPTNTIFWYNGGNDTDARGSVQARVDDTQSISYGAQANENGTVNLMRSLAVLAIQNFSAADPNAPDRFDAIANRNMERVSASHDSEPGSIQVLSAELGNAQVTLKDLSDRHTYYSSQLQGMLSDIETVPDEEVTMQMLSLQTRLQASYSAVSLVSQLSLVNYLK